MPPSQRAEIDVVAIIGADHRQAGKSALGGFGLPDDRKLGPTCEIQQPGHAHTLTLRSGSISQLISDRFSRMMSALRSISACSGMRVPYASMSGRSSLTVTRYAG